MSKRFFALVVLILVAALSRFLPHPANWTAIGAAALLAGARFPRTWEALVVPLAAMVLSDALIGFHSQVGWVYGAIALTALAAHAFRDRLTGWRIGVGAVLGSVAFFLITNFGMWATGTMYPPGADGLIASYVAAVPFFASQALGDLFYAAVLFGAWDLAVRRSLAPSKNSSR